MIALKQQLVQYIMMVTDWTPLTIKISYAHITVLCIISNHKWLLVVVTLL